MVMGRAPIDQDSAPKRMMEADFDQDWGITTKQQGNLANLEEAIRSSNHSQQQVVSGKSWVGSMDHQRKKPRPSHFGFREDSW